MDNHPDELDILCALIEADGDSSEEPVTPVDTAVVETTTATQVKATLASPTETTPFGNTTAATQVQSLLVRLLLYSQSHYNFNLQLSDVKLLPRMKHKARPKGSSQTVIGIARKRKREKAMKPVKFCNKSPIEKDRSELTFLVYFT